MVRALQGVLVLLLFLAFFYAMRERYPDVG
jgi:hypothetical protein